MFRRKIYDKLKKWKDTGSGKDALLIEGARRIGKSTIVEEFAKNEYETYILIDFNDCGKDVFELFENKLVNLDDFFAGLSYIYNVKLVRGKSLIIFDEVQKFPKAKQSIKKLVKDARYDYIETGSLISIKENIKDITIPSEEKSIKMYPMDFEEFLWALDKERLIEYIKKAYIDKKKLDRKIHNDAMDMFKKYMIIGGMPQAIIEYKNNEQSFEYCDIRKRSIIDLYRKDIMKIESMYKAKVISLFEQIPAFLSKHEKRIIFSKIEKGINTENTYENTILWLEQSMIINSCYKCNDPNIGLGINKNDAYVKCYMADTGLLFSHSFDENEIQKQNLYKQLLSDKLSINKGMLYENVIAQMLVGNNKKLYFYTNYNNEKKRNDIEIDFLITGNNKKLIPIEVKSTKRYNFNSIIKFYEKYKERIEYNIIISPKEFDIKDNIMYLPPYMVWCL